MHPKRRGRWTIVLSGQKTDSSCWRHWQISKPRKPMNGLIWNVSRANMHRSSAYLFQIYPKQVVENIFNTLGKFFTKDRIVLKTKRLRYKYIKALRLGNKVEPVGRIVSTFYDICNEDCEPLSHLSLGMKILQEG